MDDNTIEMVYPKNLVTVVINNLDLALNDGWTAYTASSILNEIELLAVLI